MPLAVDSEEAQYCLVYNLGQLGKGVPHVVDSKEDWCRVIF